jgi:beta-glucosidase
VGQVPIFYNHKSTGRPYGGDVLDKYKSRYLDVSNDPLYPFGFGLSYTTFTYGEIGLSAKEISSQEKITVTCKITNTGAIAGEEVVQLYVQDVVGSVTRPVKELKRFQKIKLMPGESKDVSFTLTSEDLSFYKRDMTWGTEPGQFNVFVGGNSRDVKKTDFVLK